MKRQLLFNMIFTLLLLTVSINSRALEPGDTAPAFELAGTSQTVRLADLHGKFVYLDFWASWCGPCKQSFPWMNGLQGKFGTQGLHVLAVNVDQKREDANQFLSEVPARFDIAFDPTGATPKSYGVKAMPSSVLIGPDGKVLYVHKGFNEQSAPEIEEKIKQALNGAGLH